MSLSIIGGLALIRYVLDIKLGILGLKTELIELWAPFIISFLLVHLVFRRRFLVIKMKDRDLTDFYYLIVTIVIGASTMGVQIYLSNQVYDLIHVEKIEEVKNYPNEKYFHVQKFSLDEETRLYSFDYNVSGEDGEDLNFYAYVVAPFKGVDGIWFGKEYSQTHANNLSNQAKNAQYESFQKFAHRMSLKEEYSNASYFERCRNSDEMDGFLHAIATQNFAIEEEDVIILTPQMGSFEHRSGVTGFRLIVGVLVFHLIIVLIFYYREIDPKGLKKYKSKKKIEFDDEIIWKVISFKEGAKGVSFIFWMCTLVFIVFLGLGMNLMYPSFDLFHEYGALNQYIFEYGEYWRFLTAPFIHIGIVHWFFAMAFFLIAGGMLEPIVKGKVFLLVFIISSILAILISIYSIPNALVFGSDSGMMGVLAFLLVVSAILKTEDAVLHLWVSIILILIKLVSSVLSGGTDFMYLAGGAFSGLILGFIYVFFQKKSLIRKEKK